MVGLSLSMPERAGIILGASGCGFYTKLSGMNLIRDCCAFFYADISITGAGEAKFGFVVGTSGSGASTALLSR